MKTSVFVICPFCGGQSPLLYDDEHSGDAEIVERFRGRRVNCTRRSCAQSFAIRRENLKIRHHDD